MKIQCAWCRKVIKDGSPPISHTICLTCKIKLEEETDEYIRKNDFETWKSFKANKMALKEINDKTNK